MERYDGILEFEYRGQTKRCKYTMDYLGGSAHIYFQDNKGGYHQFSYRDTTGEWLYGFNVPVPWPQDFQDALYAAFDEARVRHGM